VEVVCLTGTPDRHDGTWIRVTHYGSWVADVRSVAELERYFPVASLEETLGPLALLYALAHGPRVQYLVPLRDLRLRHAARLLY